MHSSTTATAAHATGARVWLEMDQQALDDAYDQAVWAPNREILLKRRRTASEQALARLGPPRRLAYGPSAIEQLDIYTTRQPQAPIHLFIHGGAWRGGLAREAAFMAEMFLSAGAHFVVPDFAWVQDVDGRLMTLAEQVRRAVAWVYTNAASFGGDPQRLYLSGHSSGAHLGGVVLVTDWPGQYGLPPDLLRGAVLISGMYDLAPVRLSKRSQYVRFDDASEAALSTQRHLAALRTPLVLAYGTEESPEFQRQSREFAAAVQAAGKPVELLVGTGYNHFEIQETLGNPFGLGGRAVLQQMQLAPFSRACV
ncbi:MAG: alpha/beta hydrolase [Candidatus Tectimicrobiota bacterium]